MSTASRELSTHDGAPVEFYLFQRGGVAWRYTSDATPLVNSQGTWVPAVISRSAPSLGKEEKHSGMQLEVARDFAIAQLFKAGSPGSSIWLSVGRTHRGETDQEWLWQGKVRGCAWTGSKATLQCDPMDKALSRATLRLSYGYCCGHRLYDACCGLLEASWTKDTTIAAISADFLTIQSPMFAEKPDGWWLRGEVYHPGLDMRQEVIAHQGQSVTLRYPMVGAKAGQALRVLRGCDHLWKRADGSWGDCVSVFQNGANYGGEPFIPQKNLFDTGLT